MNPMPSVESRNNLLLICEIVFTASICFASSEILPSISAAGFLKGNVTLRPFASESAKNSLIKLWKPSSSTLYA